MSKLLDPTLLYERLGKDLRDHFSPSPKNVGKTRKESHQDQEPHQDKS